MDFFFLNFPTLLLNMYAWLQVFLARGLQLEKTTKAANVQYILVLIFTPPPPPPTPARARARGAHTHAPTPKKKQLAALPTFKSILPERYQWGAFSSNLYSDQLLPALVFRNLDSDNLWDASNVQFL